MRRAVRLHLRAVAVQIVVRGHMAHGHILVILDILQPVLRASVIPCVPVFRIVQQNHVHHQMQLQMLRQYRVRLVRKHVPAIIQTVHVIPQARRAVVAAVMAHVAFRASRPVVMWDFIWKMVCVKPPPVIILVHREIQVLVNAINRAVWHAYRNCVRQMWKVVQMVQIQKQVRNIMVAVAAPQPLHVR